ncbi:MAG: Ferredoxin-dependent glutamate synthase 2 [Dehalococcoidia bacterium]|nr:Ferredoxin-dependent glutamate synthase 2 [Bacillota bacterium]MBT9141843.1 Ferredoxin-dependent glutamate synthase 2 [Bacillota bacterium]
MVTIDARGVYYMHLNKRIRQALKDGALEIILKNVNGQRYIADAIRGNFSFSIEGVPGNDLAAYMDGPHIVVKGNAQDAVANTMNGGTIIIHGDAGDTLGYAMRGGEVFVRGNVGYRVGIHMKEYQEQVPLIVIGGKTGDFLGEYMAGGIIVVLGLPDDMEPVGNYCGTGMHGGVMFIRGNVPDYKLGREVQKTTPTAKEQHYLTGIVSRYENYFGLEEKTVGGMSFTKLAPVGIRPYGNMYVKF